MQNVEPGKENNVPNGAAKSMQDNANGTERTVAVRQGSKMTVALKDIRIAVCKEQYESVEIAHRNSLALLDSCGNALLDAMEMGMPPKESGRQIGEYAGENLRKIAKSVCDIVNTKTNVVRSMYQVSRDEM